MREAQVVKIGHERVFLLLTDVHDGASTRGRQGELWSFHAHLSLPQLRADALIHLAPPELEAPLGAFFADLAEHWQGWEGVREWRAHEGDLALVAEHDRLGHIRIGTALRQLLKSWLVQGDVPLDAGQLDRLAADIRRFEAR